MTKSTTTLSSTGNIISSVSNAIITYTAKEQITAYGSIYGMALFCIIIGSIRSMYFVQKHIRKKRLIETSITINEAKKFPLTASCVLFGLYLFFGYVCRGRCDVECRQRIYSVVSSYLPSKLSSHLKIFPSLTNVTNASVVMEGDSSKILLQKTAHFLPFISQVNIMYLLLVLLCWEGCVALATILKPIFSYVLRKLPIGNHQPKMNYPFLWSLKRGKIEMEEGDIEEASNDDFEYVLKVEWDTHDVVAVLCCLCVGLSHLYRRHWITNNILGVAFSIYGIESIHLCSFKAGTMLLAGLFIYDVFWVFATDVMTTVAKGIDAPLLLQFPQDIYRHGLNNAGKHAMLGLGDIVIPGIFIALLRRFDHYIGSGGNCKKPRHYFLITIVAYCFGLMITMGVMHFFKAAQPALLYLVPACVLVPLSVAAIRGEAYEMLSYCEEHLIEKKNQPKKSKDEKKTD
uniref:Signal peptide peptidase n=1 Tax=Onchocerca volvulus TaxID=6282 RepID=A0A8R1TTV9_ONCVO